MSSSTSTTCKSVVLVVSPLNALLFDQISILREKRVQAAILGVKEAELDEDVDSPDKITSQWEGIRERIIHYFFRVSHFLTFTPLTFITWADLNERANSADFEQNPLSPLQIYFVIKLVIDVSSPPSNVLFVITQILGAT